MQYNDSTLVIFSGAVWLATGCFAYFILTMFKVHILWYLQPKIINSQVDPVNPFQRYFPFFFSAIISLRLYRFTFRYIFRHKAGEWVTIENKPVKKRITILDGLTNFLKPYFIIGVIFTIIRFWIASRLLYDALAITLGEVQQKLFFIEKFKPLIFLKDYKILFVLAFGVACVLIPYLSKKEKGNKKVKNYFTRSIAYFSILANISFFGAGAGSTVDNGGQKLRELEAEIISIHNQVFVQAAAIIITQDIDQWQKDYKTIFQQEEWRLADNLKQTKNITDTLIKQQVSVNIANYFRAINSEYDITYISFDNRRPPREDGTNDAQAGPVEEDKSTGKEVPPPAESFRANRYFNRKVKIKDPAYVDYFGHEEKWTKKEGLKILANVEKIVKEQPGKDKLLFGKAKKIAEKLIEAAIDWTADGFCKAFNIEPQKGPKKLFTVIMGASYTECLADRTVKTIEKLMRKMFTVQTAAIDRCSDKGVAEDERKALVYDDNVFYQAAELTGVNAEKDKLALQYFQKNNEALKKQITDRVMSASSGIPSADKLTERFENAIGSRAKDDIIEALQNKSYKYDEKLSVKENLEKIVLGRWKNEEGDLRQHLINYLIPDKTGYTEASYNDLLTKNFQNIRSESSIPKMITTNRLSVLDMAKFFPGICPRCGLPLSFPVCLAGL